MKPQHLTCQWGRVVVSLESDQLLSVKGDTDCAVFFGQGYGTAKLRLWQLDLTRRVASGRLAEIMGNAALRTDIFQRRLGLPELAERAEKLDQAAPEGSWQAQQHQHIQAYIAGINHALERMKILPIECLLLRYRPEAFTVIDSYLLGQLKYFINSAWQYELFHTRLANKLTTTQHRQLLTTFSQEGEQIAPLPLDEQMDYHQDVVNALKDGLKGLQHLGLSSPDTGSNVFAVNGSWTSSGKPLLASDPHMGQVNPNFNLLCRLESQEGLNVLGSHFPGAPGIIVGRNPQAAWGMVGIMADNQDLFWGKIDVDNLQVETASGVQSLNKRIHNIQLKSGTSHTFTTYDFAHGRLVSEKNGYGMFLRWPALDDPSGDITFYQLAKCHDWHSFRDGLRHVRNSPMMVGYADEHGDIGLQTMGYIPQRHQQLGSLLLNLTEPQHQWLGYVPFDDLPSEHNPECGYVIYANQYNQSLLDNKVPLSNRWHAPSRALRIEALIQQNRSHSLDSFKAIQDDKTDYFAQKTLPFLLSYVPEDTRLSAWNGNTKNIAESRLFDVWFQHITDALLKKTLRRGARTLYTDFWPGYRWNILNILQNHTVDWQYCDDDIETLVREAYARALVASQKMVLPQVEFQHSIKKPLWLNRFFTGRYLYDGGNRETVHATRQNADFLTQSHAGENKTVKTKPYTFGPSFKLLSDLSHQQTCWYLINTPASGSPFFWRLKPALNAWKKGIRTETQLSLLKGRS
ncbi:penicillin acylase family protein [Providencia alcalifaciens]|uniref:penicillin acylase family protein n=1 Tax=Providencia alcalifaciens TaxID=126385 RepID=UPI001CE1F214|nr:penicillin acylase family protein [Providencia alcalifaciens]UBX49105.1 penicillin acylase family protein [Providencia alcalifaciens]